MVFLLRRRKLAHAVTLNEVKSLGWVGAVPEFLEILESLRSFRMRGCLVE